MAHAGWMRNYGAMGNAKLAKSLRELEAGSGEAFDRMQSRGGILWEHMRAAKDAAATRGLMTPEQVTDHNVDRMLTEAVECSECGRVERHYIDDYVCRVCRDTMEDGNPT